MSHLHIPDGILPVWLWAAGLVAALAVVLAAIYMQRGADFKRQIPLLGMMSAMMLIGMNLEIIPISYHVNLSVITGIILGPWLGVVAAFIVNIVLALVGHGGVTVIGLNTVVVGSEAVVGWLLYRVLRKFISPFLAAGGSTFVTLFLSTCLMLVIVAAANLDLGSEPLHGMRDVVESHMADYLGPTLKFDSRFDFRFFATVALVAGIVGWTIEALVTAVAVRFIDKVKPGLLK